MRVPIAIGIRDEETERLRDEETKRLRDEETERLKSPDSYRDKRLREKRTMVKQLLTSRFIPFDWSKINGTSTTRNPSEICSSLAFHGVNNEQGTQNKILDI